jgi:flagellin-specific chaperone FliS
MSLNNTQKFESSMFEYCLSQADRSFKLIEDGDLENGLDDLSHLIDILQMLIDSKNSQGLVNIGGFSQSLKHLDEFSKDQIYTHLQENGFGQFIPE